MQSAFDVTVDYCKTREQFGKKIGEFQLMQGKMADMYMKIQSSRAFLYSLAANADEGIFCNTVKHEKYSKNFKNENLPKIEGKKANFD